MFETVIAPFQGVGSLNDGVSDKFVEPFAADAAQALGGDAEV